MAKTNAKSDLTYLINPSELNILETAGDRMPLGLLYIAQELRTHNHPVKVFDLNHDSPNKLFSDIDKEKPTMIGVSCLTTPMVRESQDLLKKLRSFLETIAEELGEIKNQGFDAVYFLDDVFTVDRPRARNVARLTNHAGLKFRATTRANYLDEDTVAEFAENGCEMISMGIESGDDYILQQIGKNQRKSDIYKAQLLCGKYGIPTKGFFIIGLPGEDQITAAETIKFSEELRSLGMESADFYALTPFPGTPIWNNPEKYGITIEDKDYSRYLQATTDNGAYVTCRTKDLNREQIAYFLSEAKQRWAK